MQVLQIASPVNGRSSRLRVSPSKLNGTPIAIVLRTTRGAPVQRRFGTYIAYWAVAGTLPRTPQHQAVSASIVSVDSARFTHELARFVTRKHAIPRIPYSAQTAEWRYICA